MFFDSDNFLEIIQSAVLSFSDILLSKVDIFNIYLLIRL